MLVTWDRIEVLRSYYNTQISIRYIIISMIRLKLANLLLKYKLKTFYILFKNIKRI